MFFVYIKNKFHLEYCYIGMSQDVMGLNFSAGNAHIAISDWTEKVFLVVNVVTGIHDLLKHIEHTKPTVVQTIMKTLLISSLFNLVSCYKSRESGGGGEREIGVFNKTRALSVYFWGGVLTN